MKGGVLQLAALSDMVNAASCDLPIEASPLSWAESGSDSANGNGGRWDLEGVHLQNDLKKKYAMFSFAIV